MIITLLILFFRAPNDDFSSTNLQTVNDNIYLNLFDEVVIDIQQVIFDNVSYPLIRVGFKETKSATMNIFRKFLFSF